MVCPPGRGRASIAAWGADRGPTAAKQHLKQNRMCAMIGGLDWWFAPRARPPIAAWGPDRGPTAAKQHPKQNRLCAMIGGLDWWFAFRAAVGLRLQRGAPIGCKAASKAKPAVCNDWWLRLVVRGRASIAAWGPDRGPTAAKQHLKQNRLCAMIGGLDWWFAPRAAVGLRLQRGARSGPDGCKAASKAKPAVCYDWWLGLVVCPPGRSRASIATWGPDRGPSAAKQHLKQNRLCAMIGGLDWWFAPRAAVGLRLQRGAPIGARRLQSSI